MKSSNTIQNEMEIVKSDWSILWWIMGSIFVPIAIPYFIYQILGNQKEKTMRNALPGKVVVITGASSGLGESLAHTFYKAGCKVVLTARRTNELERVKTDLLESYTVCKYLIFIRDFFKIFWVWLYLNIS